MPENNHFQLKLCSMPEYKDWLTAGSDEYHGRCIVCKKGVQHQRQYDSARMFTCRKSVPY